MHVALAQWLYGNNKWTKNKNPLIAAMLQVEREAAGVLLNPCQC